MHAARRSVVATVAALAGLGMVPAASVAQDAPAPASARVRMSVHGVHAPGTLTAARYHLEVAAPRRFPGMLQLVKPDRGYTRAEFRADLRRQGWPGGSAARRRLSTNLRYFGGAVVPATRTGSLWETLYAGRYWLIAPALVPGGSAITTVRVHGTPAPSRFPRVSAHVTGTDTGLRLERRIPRAGRMLIRNTGTDLDAQFLVPLRGDATYADFLRWVRHPRRAPMPLRFRGARFTAALSPEASYVLRYRLHPGTYVVVSLSSLRADRLRQVFQPLTVPAGARRSTGSPRAEGLRPAPGLTRRIQQWGGTRSRDTSTSKPSGLRGLLTRLALPTPR
ncbi:MAG: hypothetical protein M3165_06305 [Actinomycetota bacterium]|nr:hypothetical protein [Actinomycetota bacterium]